VGFPPKLLNEGEEIVLDLRPHWWQLVGPTAAFVAAVVVAILLNGIDNTPVDYIGVVLVVVALAWLAGRYVKWASTTFVVTDRRLIYRYGVVAKHGREIPLDRVNDITFRQSVFERLIGAGDLMIESGGERGQTTFSDIRRPSIVQNEIYRQMELEKDRDAARYVAPQHELSLPEQLEKLDELRQKGVISQAEFEAKKTQLLDRM
jgi:uncharacterized membrane protein YdbT with pleckstrin-like domain